MTIETKHNIGDTVCLLRDSKVVEATVQDISITIINKGISIIYLVALNTSGFKYSYLEAQLFKTKQELLEAL
jgi:predicted amino acid-binding ACT domain protein